MSSYHYGNPDKSDSWEYAASIFAAHESVNSEKTSSLPLVQFWKNKDRGFPKSNCVKKFLEECGLLEICSEESLFCFEYSVPVNNEHGAKGKASMTDLMILTNQYAIAIEAKWTECESIYEPIGKWRNSGVTENHAKVLNGWEEYINKYLEGRVCGKIMATDDMPYQLFHRIASACYAAMLEEGRKKYAVIIYHLFHSNQEEYGKAKKFAENLENAVHKISGQLADGELPISFHVILTEVKFPRRGSRIEKSLNGILERSRKESKFYNELFVLMQKANVFSFGNIERYCNTNKSVHSNL